MVTMMGIQTAWKKVNAKVSLKAASMARMKDGKMAVVMVSESDYK